MGDYHIRMQFDIEADPETVDRAISTREGVAAWWSDRVEGDPGTEGEQLRVGFPEVPQPFEFTTSQVAPERLEWRVGDFPPWWEGTSVRWELTENPDGPGTRLLFSHRGYDPDNPVIPVVTPAWAQIILRLKAYCETGKPDPFFVS